MMSMAGISYRGNRLSIILDKKEKRELDKELHSADNRNFYGQTLAAYAKRKADEIETARFESRLSDFP